MPSAVWIDDEKNALVGQKALNRIQSSPGQVFYDAKRLIGRNFSDPRIQNFTKYWPFDIVADDQDRPMYKWKNSLDKTEETVLPQYISA